MPIVALVAPRLWLLSSWPGLSRPSTPRRPNDGFEIAPLAAKACKNNAFLALGRLPSLPRIEHVDDRDKPGHDTFRCALVWRACGRRECQGRPDRPFWLLARNLGGEWRRREFFFIFSLVTL